MTDFRKTFEGATSIAEIDRRYKAEFANHDCATDRGVWGVLSEWHRRTLEAFAFGRTETTAVNPDRISPRRLRNWANSEGIPLPVKGKVPLSVENAYRRDHDLPILKEDKIERVEVDASALQIRLWARDSGVEVGGRGRIPPNVIAAYAEAHPESVSDSPNESS